MIGWAKIAASAAAAAGLAASAWLIQDRFHQKGLAEAASRCAVAAGKPAGDKGSDLDDCLPVIGLEVAAARQAATCDRTLLPTMDATTRFVMLNSCGPGAKRLVAERDTLASERDGLKTLLDRAQVNADAAVSRAESRASTQQKRTDHAQGTIAAAPRDGDGLIMCDAGCLRQIAQ